MEDDEGTVGCAKDAVNVADLGWVLGAADVASGVLGVVGNAPGVLSAVGVPRVFGVLGVLGVLGALGDPTPLVNRVSTNIRARVGKTLCGFALLSVVGVFFP